MGNSSGVMEKEEAVVNRSDCDRGNKINVQQLIATVVSVLIPLIVGLLIWGTSVETRLAKLEAVGITYVGKSEVAVISNNVEWIRQSMASLQSKQNEILQALNKFSTDLKDVR